MTQQPPPKQFADERQRALFCPAPPGETSGGVEQFGEVLEELTELTC